MRSIIDRAPTAPRAPSPRVAHKPKEDASRRLALATLALLAIGDILRLITYWQAPSLWLDEAMLALNIGARSYVDLFAPLDYAQAAPLLFLWSTRAAVVISGMSEWSARTLPFLAGLGFLPACWYLARRLLPEAAATIALAFAALSPLLLRYGNEMKPYGVDALVAAIVAVLLLRALERSEEPGVWWALGIVGTLAIWISTPSPFVLGGALALLLAPHVRRSLRAIRMGMVCAVAWGISFAVAYLTFYRPASQISQLRAYWADSYLDVRPSEAARRVADLAGGLISATFLEHDFFDLTTQALRFAYVGALCGLAVLGTRDLAKARGVPVLGLLFLPTVLGLIASALRLYPTASVRLTMYAVPPLLVVTAAGVVALASWGAERVRGGMALVITTVALIPAVVHDVIAIQHPFQREHVRPIVGEAVAQDGVLPVYIVAPGVPQWLYYTTDWRAPDRARIEWFADVERAARGSVRYDRAERVELVGTPSRTQTQGMSRFSHMKPGWADAEARRILQNAPDCALIFAGHHASGDLDSLTAALSRRGRRVQSVAVAAGAVLLRTCSARAS